MLALSDCLAELDQAEHLALANAVGEGLHREPGPFRLMALD
jgi:hypothetical protein